MNSIAIFGSALESGIASAKNRLEQTKLSADSVPTATAGSPGVDFLWASQTNKLPLPVGAMVNCFDHAVLTMLLRGQGFFGTMLEREIELKTGSLIQFGHDPSLGLAGVSREQ